MNIRLQSIARLKSDNSGMEELFAGEITRAVGLQGDQFSASKDGEVTVLSKESWVKCCHEMETELPWLAHGTNLFIKGFEFLPTDIGRTLRIGEAELEIVRAMYPSQMLRDSAPQLCDALLLGWRSGIVCRVLRGGSVQTGHEVHLI